ASSTWEKDRPASPYMPFSSLRLSYVYAMQVLLPYSKMVTVLAVVSASTTRRVCPPVLTLFTPPEPLAARADQPTAGTVPEYPTVTKPATCTAQASSFLHTATPQKPSPSPQAATVPRPLTFTSWPSATVPHRKVAHTWPMP